MTTLDAPAAIGPYVQAVKVGDLLFCSGCIPLDPSTAQVVTGGIEAQTTQALKNLAAVVKAGGSELGKVVKTTVRVYNIPSLKNPISIDSFHCRHVQVFLKSMDDFVTVNGIYEQAFGSHKPARSAVEVARLPKDVLVEIECIARCVDGTELSPGRLESRL